MDLDVYYFLICTCGDAEKQEYDRRDLNTLEIYFLKNSMFFLELQIW